MTPSDLSDDQWREARQVVTTAEVLRLRALLHRALLQLCDDGRAREELVREIRDVLAL